MIIIGSGPAGLTSAIYAARAALNPVLVEGAEPGGQLTTTSIVENFPGFEKGIQGPELMTQMRKQAENVGTEFKRGRVKTVEKTKSGFRVVTEKESLDTETLIIATGASAITLPLPNLEKLMGYGISTCAVCDGFFYKGKKVAVIGGGDSAMEQALYLARIATEVFLIHRKNEFRASKIMQEKVLQNKSIKVIWKTNVVDTKSDNSGLTGLILKSNEGQSSELEVDGLFMAIGHKPNTDFINELVKTDDKGYILTQNGTKTSLKGCYAAGDVEDKIYRQAITSAGRGCQAALQAERYIEFKS